MCCFAEYCCCNLLERHASHGTRAAAAHTTRALNFKITAAVVATLCLWPTIVPRAAASAYMTHSMHMVQHEYAHYKCTAIIMNSLYSANTLLCSFLCSFLCTASYSASCTADCAALQELQDLQSFRSFRSFHHFCMHACGQRGTSHGSPVSM